MICRLFIDEVGNSDLSGSAEDDNVRYLSLTGVLTTLPYHDSRFTPGLNALKAGVFKRTDIVLHRREIVRREGPFAMLRDNPILQQTFDEGIRLLVRELPYIAKTVTIDKRAHLAQYHVWHFDPYHYCMRCLIERYVSWLQRLDLYGDVVIEERFKKADKRVKDSFKKLYYEGTENVSPKQFQKRLLSHDIGFYKKRHNIAAMQICDLLAHPSYRSMKFERDRLPEPTDFGASLVEILKERRYARHPKTMRIDGWGRKWLP